MTAAGRSRTVRTARQNPGATIVAIAGEHQWIAHRRDEAGQRALVRDFSTIALRTGWAADRAPRRRSPWGSVAARSMTRRRHGPPSWRTGPKRQAPAPLRRPGEDEGWGAARRTRHANTAPAPVRRSCGHGSGSGGDLCVAVSGSGRGIAASPPMRGSHPCAPDRHAAAPADEHRPRATCPRPVRGAAVPRRRRRLVAGRLLAATPYGSERLGELAADPGWLDAPLVVHTETGRRGAFEYHAAPTRQLLRWYSNTLTSSPGQRRRQRLDRDARLRRALLEDARRSAREPASARWISSGARSRSAPPGGVSRRRAPPTAC